MIWRAFLLAALVQFYPAVYAASSATASRLYTTYGLSFGFDDCEHELNAQIAQTTIRVGTSQFKVEREFEEYQRLLHAPGLPDLYESLQNLPAGAVWMDLGAGKAHAQRNFLNGLYHANQLIHFVSLSFDQPQDETLAGDIKDYTDHFEYIATGFLEEAMARPCHPIHAYKSKVDYLTEVWGPSVYSGDINKVFDFIADTLKVGGQARLLFGFQTTFYTDGKQLSFEEAGEALARATGGRLRLVNALRRNGVHWVGLFEKVSEVPVEEARRLNLTEFWDGGPPNRVFEVPAGGVTLAQ